MLTNPGSGEKNTASHQKVARNPLFYSSLALAIAAVVVAWIMVSRWQQNRSIERRDTEQQAQKRLENDRLAVEQLGGKDLSIQSFYANPRTIQRGESAQLCYGAANAKTVKLEPQPNPVWPSYSRCVSVSPAHTTTYTLTIGDNSGNVKTADVEVTVQ